MVADDNSFWGFLDFGPRVVLGLTARLPIATMNYIMPIFGFSLFSGYKGTNDDEG